MIALPLGLLTGFLFQIFILIFLSPCLALNESFRFRILGIAFRTGCALWACWLNPFWRLQVVKKAPEGYKPSNTILMCNHLSGADAFFLTAAIWPWETKYIYKSDLRKVPFLGWGLVFTGDIPVYFTKEKGGWATVPGSTAKMMQRCGEILSSGMPLAVFPEGTRSKTGRLQPFKNGMFKVAIDNKSEILPIALCDSNYCWPTGSNLMRPGSIKVMIGTPVSSEGKTVEGLRDEVRLQMIQLLKLSPTYDEVAMAPLTEMAATRGENPY